MPSRLSEPSFEELRVDARVGIYAREKAAPQRLELNITFGVPDSAAEHDAIGDTIDYAEVIERIRFELGARHFNLLETLGEFVVRMLLDDFGAPWVKIQIAKLGVMRGVRRVGVFIQRGRDGFEPPKQADGVA